VACFAQPRVRCATLGFGIERLRRRDAPASCLGSGAAVSFYETTWWVDAGPAYGSRPSRRGRPSRDSHSFPPARFDPPYDDCEGVAMEWVAELLPLVSWAICRYGFFANRAKGAGFGASRSRIDAASKAHASPTNPDARPP
jgi:hypothetical protein